MNYSDHAVHYLSEKGACIILVDKFTALRQRTIIRIGTKFG